MFNNYGSLGKALGFTLRMYTKKLQDMLKSEKIPLSVDQFVLLNIVHNHQTDITQIDLANYVGKDKSAVLRHIDYLEQVKLLGRSEDINDRRRKNLKLTHKGEELLNKGRMIEQKLTLSVMKGMTKTEAEHFMKTMDLILNNILTLDNS